MADGLSTFGTVWLVLFVPLHTIFSLLYFYRRNAFPISGRYPRLPMLQCLVYTPICVEWGISLHFGPNPIPCFAFYWFYVPFVISFLWITTIRATLLLFAWEITADSLQAEQLRVKA